MSDRDADLDDETRRLLSAADPARSLPPADVEALAPLLEDTMSQPRTDQQPTRRGPSRLLLAGGLVAAASVAAVVIVFAAGGDDPKGGTSAPAGTAATPSVTRLQASSGAGRCMVPTARLVARQDLAFEGTVTSVKAGVVTLAPHRFYTGTPTDLVTVADPDHGSSEAIHFRPGQDYVVGANGGQVSPCLSGVVSDELRAAYAEAFPR